MSKSNTTKPVTVVSQIVAIMEKMKDKPMAATVEKLATTVLAKNGKPIGAGRARAYYRDLVTQGEAPGKVERAVKAPKAPKAPKMKPAKPATDRKEALKAAAKRAGIHKDSVKEAKGEVEVTGEDPLNLAAPESLSFDDLKNLL